MSSTNFNVHSTFAQFFSKDGLNPWLYHLSQSMEAGNVCLDINQKFEVSDEVNQPDVAVLKNHEWVGDSQATLPFILHEDKLYLHRFFHYEKALVEKIKALIANEHENIEAQKLLAYKDIINNELFASNKNLQITDWQKVACLNAFLNRFSIISGGPGTGKTTTVTKLLALFLSDNPELKITICAPTGKAAARLEESISKAETQFKNINIDTEIIQKIAQLKASTIHSLLGYIPNSIHFKHNEDNTLECDILIVDECSMIDMSLFYKLFKAIDSNRTKVILLGDKNQLASVDAGSVFRDLCSDSVASNQFSEVRTAFINQFMDNAKQQIEVASKTQNQSHPLFQHIIELHTSYRFNDEAGIGKLSKAVLNNDKNTIASFLKNEDDIVKFYSQEVLQEQLEHAAQLLKKENGGYIGLENIEEILNHTTHSTILSAVKEGKNGIYAINNFISQYLFNPSEKFYSNQLVMVTQNQNREQIYNGDMGVLIKDNDKLKVFFKKSNDSYIKLSPAQILASDTAFAMTIHKSQGSEFNEVLIVLPDQKENLLLTRELLYTAITRARQKVTIIGNEDIIYTIASQSVKRISGIASQFN